MSLSVGKVLGYSDCDKTNNITLSGLGLSRVTTIGLIVCDIEIDGSKYTRIPFNIIPKYCMPFELVLGNDFLRRVVVVMNGGTVWMQPKN
jgi:hypothetical protein